MALLDFLRSSPVDLEGKRVHQILAIAGSGKLQDGSETSAEFRAFLGQVPARVLARYASECLTEKFDQGGLALQDVINEIGRRLGFGVEDGRYRGAVGKSGHDGLWTSGSDAIVVEVKTTDAYRINLDTLAGYRRQLVQASTCSEESSSILIIVGRQDTGDLEAQIRGSRYGWNIRLISIDALVRLLQLKETVADPAILDKIVGILLPREFTRVDGIIHRARLRLGQTSLVAPVARLRAVARRDVHDQERGPLLLAHQHRRRQAANAAPQGRGEGGCLEVPSMIHRAVGDAPAGIPNSPRGE